MKRTAASDNGYCLKILGCEILASNYLLPNDFPNPLNFDLEKSNLQISICKAGTMTVIHPNTRREGDYRGIGKGNLFGHKVLRDDQVNSNNVGLSNLFWSRRIGNYQINNMEPNPVFGMILNNGENFIYEVPDLGLDCFDMCRILSRKSQDYTCVTHRKTMRS